MHICLSELEKKYWEGIDPRRPGTPPDARPGVRTVARSLEQEKFTVTRGALAQRHYLSAVELGCGDGALARGLAPCCEVYADVDGIERAVHAARQAVPDARSAGCVLPRALPGGPHDLIILSEILHFLARDHIDRLADEIAQFWPRAEIICVTRLGEIGHMMQTEEVLQTFFRAMGPDYSFTTVGRSPDFRVDRHLWREQNARPIV